MPVTPALAQEVPKIEYNLETAPLVLEAFAVRYGINSKEFIAVAKCESGFRASAIGDKGKSHGVFQIHLGYHPDVSKEEALDPLFNIEWAAKEFAKGEKGKRQWTCYRNLYGDS